MKPYAHATEVQTLLFDQDIFTVKAAKAWARSHGFRYGKVDVSGSRAQYIRLRQHDPSEYRPSTFRTISLDADETVKAIVGVPLRAAAATRPAGYDSRGPRQNPAGAPEFVPFGKLDPRDGYQIDGNRVAFWSSKKDAQAVGRAVGWPARMLTPLHTRFQKGWGFADAGHGFLSLDYFARVVAQLPENVRGTLPLGNLRSRLQRIEYERGRTNPRSAFAAHPGYDPPSEWAVFNRQGEKFGIYKARSEDAAISQALAYYGVAPEDVDPTLRAAPVPDGSLARWRTTRRNGAPRVRVPGLGLGVVVAQRPGGMVDVRLSSGTVVRKPASSLTPA